MSIYLHDWKDGGFRQMVADFEDVYLSDRFPLGEEDAARLEAALASDRWRDVEVLLAAYCCENYSGDAFVLFRRDGKLYEVNGSHCSCYGLGQQTISGDRETQWEPEETTIAALRHRLDNGSLGNEDYGDNKFANELREVLDGLERAA